MLLSFGAPFQPLINPIKITEFLTPDNSLSLFAREIRSTKIKPSLSFSGSGGHTAAMIITYIDQVKIEIQR